MGVHIEVLTSCFLDDLKDFTKFACADRSENATCRVSIPRTSKGHFQGYKRLQDCNLLPSKSQLQAFGTCTRIKHCRLWWNVKGARIVSDFVLRDPRIISSI